MDEFHGVPLTVVVSAMNPVIFEVLPDGLAGLLA